MTVKELIKLTGSILKLHDFITGEFFKEESTDCETAQALLLCYNLSLSEIAQDYCPLYQSVKLASKGQVKYSDISTNTIASIKSVKTPAGSTLNFKCYDTYLQTESGDVVITYTYLPQPCASYDQTVMSFGTVISPRLLAFKMASEFCYINNFYEAATMWDSRFKDAIKSATRTVKNVYIKDRSFI